MSDDRRSNKRDSIFSLELLEVVSDNKIFDYVRDYLAEFVINSFQQYEGRT